MGLDVGGWVGDDAEAAAGEDVEAEVAASFGPFVGLLGQDGADEAGDPCLSRCSGTAGGSGCVVVDGAREQMDR